MHRRIAMVLCVVATVAAVQAQPAPQSTPPATPQAAPPQQPTPPAAAAKPAAPAVAFASEAGMILSPILPAQTAVFEDVMQKVRDALQKSADPVRQQQAAGWKVYKSAEPFQGNTLYLSVMDPAVKGADYNVFEVIKEAMGDAEARVLFEQLRTAYAGPMHVVNMAPFISMAPVK